MAVREIPLAKSGLITVEEAAEKLDCAVRTFQKWIEDGLIQVHVVGTGKRKSFLIRKEDLKSFERPKMGRPKS